LQKCRDQKKNCRRRVERTSETTSKTGKRRKESIEPRAKKPDPDIIWSPKGRKKYPAINQE